MNLLFLLKQSFKNIYFLGIGHGWCSPGNETSSSSISFILSLFSVSLIRMQGMYLWTLFEMTCHFTRAPNAKGDL